MDELTENQLRFFAIAQEFPRIAHHWDRDTASLDLEGFAKDLDVMSSGEAAIARFFAAVWLGQNKFGFDLVSHISDCDSCAQAIISAWVVNHFFP